MFFLFGPIMVLPFWLCLVSEKTVDQKVEALMQFLCFFSFSENKRSAYLNEKLSFWFSVLTLQISSRSNSVGPYLWLK